MFSTVTPRLRLHPAPDASPTRALSSLFTPNIGARIQLISELARLTPPSRGRSLSP